MQYGLKSKDLWLKTILFVAVYMFHQKVHVTVRLTGFDTFETDLIGFAAEHENADICLLGDFNARTSNLDDTLLLMKTFFRILILTLT